MSTEREDANDDGKPLLFLRTRRAVVRAYGCVGVVAVFALSIFGPSWTLWVPIMGLFLLSLFGLGHLLGVRFWSEPDSTSGDG